MRTKLALLATTTLAALAIATPAQAAGSSWYLGLTGGANWLGDNDFSTTFDEDLAVNSEADTGYVIAGAVGLSLGQMMQGLRVEAEVGYRQNQVDGTWTSLVGVELGDIAYDHSALSVLANVWYDFNAGSFKPYIGGGIGWADVEIDGAYAGTEIRSFSYSNSGFAWQAGGGINFQVAPSVQLGVGYRYFSGTDVDLLAADVVNNSALGTLDHDNHSAVVTLIFGL
jgi:opacity protein-like surface antigen